MSDEKDRLLPSGDGLERLDLAAIEARYQAAKRAPVNNVTGEQMLWASAKDVPVLVAEVRRCHAALADMAKPRTPVCASCGDTITYIPKSGFGNVGEWRHLAPPKVGTPRHDPVPQVFTS